LARHGLYGLTADAADAEASAQDDEARTNRGTQVHWACSNRLDASRAGFLSHRWCSNKRYD
jgi:hypothetical protein